MTTLQFDTLALTIADHVATIRFTRPERLNSFTGQMLDDLFAAFDRTDTDDLVRAVILTGEGRAFCAGADLSNGAQSFDYAALDAEGRGGALGDSGDGRDSGGKLTLRMYRSLKPLICAINGDAVGVGATMTLAADVRVATSSARFGFVFARRGVVPEACSTWFLPRIVGISQALDWCYAGSLIPAEEALRAGLLRACVAPGDLIAEAERLARRYVEASAPVSVAMTRQMMWQMLGADSPVAAHRVESAAMRIRGASADAREGISSFFERRAPHFPGLVSDSGPFDALEAQSEGLWAAPARWPR